MALTEQEQINYLANVVALAHMDASLSPKEITAIEEVRIALGAKKGILNAATKSVESGGYIIAPIGDFATRIRNIADMLYVCYVDGKLADNEKKAIVAVCRAVGLTQEQLNLMVKEAIARSTSVKTTCPKCGTEASGHFKFCPKCGEAIGNVETAPVPTDFDVPSSGYAIQFCESTAADFDAALNKAKTAPAFTSCIRNKKTWYMACWPEKEFAEACDLAQSLRSLRNKKVYRSGTEVTWNELFGFLWCAVERSSAYRPTEYCFGKDENRINPWGCRQAGMEWTEWARWFSYGQFHQAGLIKKSAVWVFDKARIRHELMTNLHACRHCPHLRTALVEAVLNAMPNEVQVTTDGPWKFSHAHEQVPGSIKVVEIEQQDGFEYKNEYFADGVRPRGPQALSAVLRKAFAAAGISDITATDLLSRP
ncbi:MAG: zinc ribbon domain-containing protein [Phycisphaerales bacterium]|nr:zinc ribbon domain-containing protein [Phycisphaerales bacterium]